MRILVIGAGSVGGYFGGRLALAGNELFFMARGNHLRELKENGLSVESVNGDFNLKVPSEESFGPLDKLDLILVCVKNRDTASVLPVVAEQLGDETSVISLQNGVESEDKLSESVPSERIIGGLAYIGSMLTAPGKIRHSASGKITIGELDGTQTGRLLKFKEMFRSAGIPCNISETIMKDKWAKLMWNVGFNGLSALTGKSANSLVAYPPTCGIVRKLMEELIEVAGKKGISINPGLIDRNIEFLLKTGEIIPSMLQDIRTGRPSENDIINGKVYSEGQKVQVATPYNEMVWAAISLIDKNSAD